MRAAGGRLRRQASLLERFAALPQIVAVIDDTRGLTIEGVPIELVATPPEAFGTALLRATGSAGYVAALGPLPDRPRRARGVRAARPALAPAGAARGAVHRQPPALLEETDIRGDLHTHTTWCDGRFSVEAMGRAARDRGYDYLAICDHTPAVGAAGGLTGDDVRRQGEEIAAANEAWRRSASCAASSATSCPTAGSTFPTRCWRSSTGSRPASTAASGCHATS